VTIISYLFQIKKIVFVGFEVLIKAVFWDITPCSLLEANRILRDNVACVFRAEEHAKHEARSRQ
jgi:hypothetical protein